MSAELCKLCGSKIIRTYKDDAARTPSSRWYCSNTTCVGARRWGDLVVHCKHAKYDVYIGRPSKWGNPFSHQAGTLAKFRVATRDDAVRRYRAWLLEQPELMAALPELRGKVLGCWCAPQACHGDVLAELANQ